jgi:hypothetical protein
MIGGSRLLLLCLKLHVDALVYYVLRHFVLLVLRALAKSSLITYKQAAIEVYLMPGIPTHWSAAHHKDSSLTRDGQLLEPLGFTRNHPNFLPLSRSLDPKLGQGCASSVGSVAVCK